MRGDVAQIGVDAFGRLWDDHGVRVALRGRLRGRPRWRAVLSSSEARMAGGVAMGVFVASAGLGLGMAGGPPVLPLGLGVVVMGGGWSLIRGVQFMWPGRWERETAAMRLRLGACGACGFHIEDLPRDGYGGVRCPECGATWMVDRFAGQELAAW